MKKIKESSWFAELDNLVTKALDTGLFPGCALSVRISSGIRLSNAWGRTTFAPWSPEVSAEGTYYDLASLSKPIATACSIITLISRGSLGLQDRIGNILDNIPRDKFNISVRQLLSHSSGFPAHVPFYRNWLASTKKGLPPSFNEILRAILELPLEYHPGTRSVYSDIGFMLLAAIITKVSGMPYSRYVKKAVLHPLGAHDIIGPSPTPCQDLEKRLFAPTGLCPFENRMIQGEVNDLNARAGFSGHAGLFATSEGLISLLETLLEIYSQQRVVTGFNQGLLSRFWQRDASVNKSTWALGFDTPSAQGSSAGSSFSKKGVGHLGFTGTSFWIDPEKGIIIVFLSNRTFPRATPQNQQLMKEFRPVLHDTIMSFIEKV